jgi:hypothetical protein
VELQDLLQEVADTSFATADLGGRKRKRGLAKIKQVLASSSLEAQSAAANAILSATCADIQLCLDL